MHCHFEQQMSDRLKHTNGQDSALQCPGFHNQPGLAPTGCTVSRQLCTSKVYLVYIYYKIGRTACQKKLAPNMHKEYQKLFHSKAGTFIVHADCLCVQSPCNYPSVCWNLLSARRRAGRGRVKDTALSVGRLVLRQPKACHVGDSL